MRTGYCFKVAVHELWSSEFYYPPLPPLPSALDVLFFFFSDFPSVTVSSYLLIVLLSVCLSACLSACLSVCLPACLPACQSVCLFVCLPVVVRLKNSNSREWFSKIYILYPYEIIVFSGVCKFVLWQRQADKQTDEQIMRQSDEVWQTTALGGHAH